MSILDLIKRDLYLDADYVLRLANVAESHYRDFKSGKRWIEAPYADLKIIQCWILDFIRKNSADLPAFVAAYESGRSLLSNAEIHRKNAHLLLIDIKDFFPSCSTDKVAHFFETISVDGNPSWRLSKDDVLLLLKLSTKEGSLPLGSPCSPAIANRIMLPIDYEILSKIDPTYSYSRYSDDICISSKSWIDSNTTLRQVQQILASSDFGVNKSKVHFAGRGQSRKITGVYITPDGDFSIGKERKTRLRKMLYEYLVKGNGDPRQIHGFICFCKMIDPAYVSRTISKYAMLDSSGGMKLEEVLSGRSSK